MWCINDRPIDFLGYVIFGDGKIKIRKKIKKRFAKKWKMVKSIKRKKELIGSFYGICKHAHSKHLFKNLIGITMENFANFGYTYQISGKKEFLVHEISLLKLCRVEIIVKDFETGIKTK